MSNGYGCGELHNDQSAGRRRSARSGKQRTSDQPNHASFPKRIDLIGHCSKGGSGGNSPLSSIAPANL
jgi:hypothetical protein